MENIVKENGLEKLEVIKWAADQFGDWVIITDAEGVVVYANPQVENLSGYTPDQLIGQTTSVLKSDLVSEKFYEEMWETILSGESYVDVIANRHKNGNLYYIAVTISPIKDQKGEIQYFISVGKNINDGGKLKKQIHSTIHYDTLTGLLNRNSFVERLLQAKENCGSVAVIAININKLGLINSKYGFLSGDHVIQSVSNRIEKAACEGCIVSRIGGKVLGVLIPDFKDVSKIVNLIHKIEKEVRMPIQIKDEEVYVTMSFGISTYLRYVEGRGAEDDPDLLLTRAQLALSQAKTLTALENYAFYTSAMNEEASNLVSRENEIYTAYKNSEFISYFQPFIDMETGKISGLEALMRRKIPSGEIVAPGHFISILEETGLIIPVGFKVIREICIQIRSWTEKGFNVPVSINLSPMQFKDEFLCEKLIKIIEEEKVSPNQITFEITESMLIDDIQRTICILDQLRCCGFSVSLDDFGTGYSSLSYIQKFKINNLKIDMSFIRNIVDNDADKAIVKAIIMMAKALDLYTVAEGVETKEQLDILKELGCDVGQGYYWDRPLPADEVLLKY